ncbi:MAG: hypothetical protein ACK4ND_17400 [Cytophagaceae bacterium]
MLEERYKEIFWDAFHKPKLLSIRFAQKWQELEILNDQLAGPLFAIYEKGNCDYIFADQERFSNINTPDELFEKMVKGIQFYKSQIEEIEAGDENEAADKQVLFYQTDLKMELAELAYEMTKPKGD